jgi:hypothetical protein
MKKCLLFISSVCCLFATVVAQPILTSTQNNPIIGDVFVVRNTNAVAQGPAGTNQTWNLSSMAMSSTLNWTVMNSASTPSGSSFPSANVAIYDGTNYGYYQTSASQWLNWGAIGSGVVFSYTNSEVTLNYPFTFGNSVVDTWGCNFTASSINFARYGTTTITADGYGTVITPAGTYSNVLRIHMVQAYKDSAIGFPLMINYVNDEYLWAKPGTHYFLATTFTLTNSSSAPSSGGSYLNSIVSGVERTQGPISSFEVFPNPAVNVLNLNYTSISTGKAELYVYNTLGQKMISKEITFEQGANEVKLDVEELPQGNYFIQIQANGAIVRNQKFVILR